MTNETRIGWDDIDPAVFIHSDGQAYLYWGNTVMKYAKLKPNMTEFEGPIHTVGLEAFTEASYLHKHKDTYYLSYSRFFPEETVYMTGPSATGPWAFGGAICARSRAAAAPSPGYDHADFDLAGQPGLQRDDIVMRQRQAAQRHARVADHGKEKSPVVRIGVQVESSNVLLDRLQHGKLDFMIGRILETGDTSGLLYEELTEEPACAVARPGHPLLERRDLTLNDINGLPWILPAPGSILRHRFDMMFRRAGLEPPVNVVDTTALLLVTALLQRSDSLHVMPLEVAL